MTCISVTIQILCNTTTILSGGVENLITAYIMR